MKPLLMMMALAWSSFASAGDALDVFLGDFDGTNSQRFAYKFNVVTPSTTVVLNDYGPYLEVDEDDRLEYAVYQETGIDTWSVIYRSGIRTVAEDDEGFLTSDPVNLTMLAGETYAIGFHIVNQNVRYYYATGLDLPQGIAGIGTADGAVWVTDEGAEELGDVIEDNLDGGTLYAMELRFVIPADDDGDGFDSTVDCDDDDATSFPGAPESCNGVDNDCDGTPDNDPVYVTYYLDSDGDGFGGASIDSCNGPVDGTIEVGGDCSDVDPNTYPGAPERCNILDDDCDTLIDEDIVFVTAYEDADGDGYGGIATAEDFCDGVPDDRTLTGGDCADDDATVYPNAPERCDNEDNDCDGFIDEDVVDLLWYPDGDGDGYGDASSEPELTCDVAPMGFVGNNSDCDDLNDSVRPGAPELCDGLDNDCNGLDDDELTFESWFPDGDGDGYGHPDQKVETCDGPPAGFIDRGRDCDDADPTAYPGAIEICDGVLNDCNGNLLDGESVDADLDGVPLCGDCNDTDLTIYPGAPELCDGFDHDCDGVIPAVDECDPFIAESINVNGSCGATTIPTGPVGWGWLFAMTALLWGRRRS